MAEDKDQKTEQPSYKRLQDAREKGNVPYSREVANFLLIGILALTVGAFSPSILYNTKMLLIPLLSDADSIPVDVSGAGNVLRNVVLQALGIIMIPILFIMISGIGARLLQSGFIISFEPLMPKISKVNPMEGLKRIFSTRSLAEFLKALVKFSIVSYVGYQAIAGYLDHVQQLPDTSIVAILLFMKQLAIKLIIGILIAMFFIMMVDIFYQRYEYTKNLKMTKQEVKDEYKQMEGDPKIKSRLRKLRMEKARQRMMGNVPKADVVITNPTHYAVALQYDSKEMKAPKVVAKGQDLIALKIREVAEEHDVPIVENPPLARALFTSAELDEEIPMMHYEAVAKVISYVYQLKGKKM